MKWYWRLLELSLLACLLFAISQPAQAQSQNSKPIVHAVLFYSNTCGHCEYVITQVLPPLLDQHGEQLKIIGVNISTESGSILFRLALQKFNLQSGGVPFLVIDDTYLVGSLDIPEKLPGMIEAYLSQGGVGWPDIPGLDEALEAANVTESETPTDAPTQSAIVPAESEENAFVAADPDLGDRLNRDPEGNALSIIVLVVMVASALWVMLNYRHIKGGSQLLSWNWAIPVLCILGLGVSAYLGYVETAHVEAVCGPVGDCNTVQQSEYAILFGVLPVGILGIIGNLAILAAWAINRYGKKEWSTLAGAAMLAMSAFGLLFSIYLTYLEPFVIGATCAWCLSSAVIMTALFWLSLAEGKRAVSRLVKG